MDLIALMDEDGVCDIPIHGSEEIPIRVFSAAELVKATESFNRAQLLTIDGFWEIYRGSFKKHNLNLALIKKYKTDSPSIKSQAVRDTATAAQMCNHGNVLKLVGVCLELEGPALIYEHPENVKLLSDVLFRNGSLAWKTRLGLACDIASAILHMHTAFPSRIVHRNLKLENIFLVNEEIAKLFDFSFAICIPPGKSEVNDAIVGTRGFFESEYVRTGSISEKIDVHDFGMMLVEILAGRRDYATWEMLDSMEECMKLNLIVDNKILEEEGGREIEPQLRGFAELGLKCLNEKREMRPTMREVFDELIRLQQLALPSSLA